MKNMYNIKIIKFIILYDKQKNKGDLDGISWNPKRQGRKNNL